MRSHTYYTKLGMSASKFKAYRIVVMCVCFALGLSACRKRSESQDQSKPLPPALSHCTYIEVPCELAPEPSSRRSRFFDPNFFSPSEINRLNSLKKFVINDKKTIKNLASEISSGSYIVSTKKILPPIGKPTFSFVCYRNEKRVESITIYGQNIIMTQNGHWFSYDRNLPNLLLLGPPEIRQFTLRLQCAFNLLYLHEELLWFSRSMKAYPVPIGWGEMLVVNKFAGNKQSIRISEKEMRGLFVCPGADIGKGHYAINPDCELNSPPDMVLLFETKAGWNQHGGPELFTFDNHDPHGGCVLLNDGTVKFIRTKEELHQLRWK